jgi:hypothetical protein
MEYEEKYPTLLPWQQPTLDYGLAYLRHDGTIINEKYDESITHAYNWPKFTKYCCAKFLCTTKTFLSVNWKAFQHQGEKLNINWRTHLLKFVYKWLPIGETLVRIDSSASPKCPSCNTTTKTHNHIFRCKNANCWQITKDCIAQIDQINHKWEVPMELTKEISVQLSSWTSETLQAADQLATNHDHINSLESQTRVGWGRFLKGFITTDLQKVVNNQINKPQNAFEQMQRSCDLIQCLWDSEAEHWKCCNGD